MPVISNSQNIFLNQLDTRFKAFVGGYGCVSPETRVWTEHGLVPISHITKLTRVVSWNEKSQKFQLSLSGGSFPKGKANLYRVSTRLGEFVSTAHHHIFSSDRNYSPVSDFFALPSQKGLLQTNLEFDQLLSFLDVQHYTKTDANYLHHCASANRLHGQRLLADQDICQSSSPLLDDVHKLHQCSDPYVYANKDGLAVLKLEHTHHGLSFGLTYMIRLVCQTLNRASFLASQTLRRFSERTLSNRLTLWLSREKFLHHHIKRQSLIVSHSLFMTPVESVVLEKEQSLYYDMQVLETNNYVCENGFIHHNSGKTWVGCLDLSLAALKEKTVQGYFGVTYPSIRDIFYPTMEEVLYSLDMGMNVNLGNKEVTVYRYNRYHGTIICRSMDNPSSIVGFKISRSLVDEIDTIPKDKAEMAWNRIIARLRLPLKSGKNTIGVTTTPEGFGFAYDRFYKNATENYSMVRASTYENEEFLPDGYIDSLIDTYPENLIQAYVEGQFVNLTSGSVYNNYDRKRNNSNLEWDGKEPVFIGMDFNVGKMAAIVHIKRDGSPIAVDEIIDAYDTPNMIDIIKSRYRDCTIRVYPDASGSSRKSMNASQTDISMLQSAGFRVIFPKKNPFVKDRVNAMNRALLNAKGEVEYKINTDKCPTYADCLEQQVWRNGEPDKSAGVDHANDAGGYFIAYDYPIIKPVSSIRVSFSR